MHRTPYMVGVVISVALVVLTTSKPVGAPKFSDWRVPTNLGPPVNSPFQELGAAISKDGLSLYFTSDHPGGFGSFDLWVSERPTTDGAWGQPRNLGGIINTSAEESIPALSRDGHWMFFNSDRPGGFGLLDIWASWREHTHDNFSWGPPFNLGASVNSAYVDGTASYFANDEGGAPLLFFISTRPGGPGLSDIYESQLQPDGLFGPPALVSELSSPGFFEIRPSVRFDGLEVIFTRASGTPVNGDLWVSTRRSLHDAWSTPRMLGAPINTPFNDHHAYIAGDRETLYFSSNRPNGSSTEPNYDIYVTTRTKE
jgi:WD40 repeat protein